MRTNHRSYEGFAYVYDTFMDNVPYEEWAEYVTGTSGRVRHYRRAGAGSWLRYGKP